MRPITEDRGLQEMLRIERGLAHRLRELSAKMDDGFPRNAEGELIAVPRNLDAFMELLREHGILANAHLEISRSIWRLKANWKE